jgi:transposase-like protein
MCCKDKFSRLKFIFATHPKRIRQHLKMSGTSYRVDETYIKVGKTCKYLYRAVDKEGNTLEFMLVVMRIIF